MADLRHPSPLVPDHRKVKWRGREPSRYPKESGSIFKGTIPFSRAGVLSIQVYKVIPTIVVTPVLYSEAHKFAQTQREGRTSSRKGSDLPRRLAS